MSRLLTDKEGKCTKEKEEKLLRSFYIYLTDPKEENFQEILNLIESKAFRKIKITWRDPVALRGNLQKMLDSDKNIWLCFWLNVADKLEISYGDVHESLWEISPFSKVGLIVLNVGSKEGLVTQNSRLLAEQLTYRFSKSGIDLDGFVAVELKLPTPTGRRYQIEHRTLKC